MREMSVRRVVMLACVVALAACSDEGTGKDAAEGEGEGEGEGGEGEGGGDGRPGRDGRGR